MVRETSPCTWNWPEGTVMSRKGFARSFLSCETENASKNAVKVDSLSVKEWYYNNDRSSFYAIVASRNSGWSKASVAHTGLHKSLWSFHRLTCCIQLHFIAYERVFDCVEAGPIDSVELICVTTALQMPVQFSVLVKFFCLSCSPQMCTNLHRELCLSWYRIGLINYVCLLTVSHSVRFLYTVVYHEL